MWLTEGEPAVVFLRLFTLGCGVVGLALATVFYFVS